MQSDFATREGALNAGCVYTERIGPKASGQSVLDYLASTRTHSSAQVWGARIARGEVELDGAPADADGTLRAGHTLVWRRPPWIEPAVPLHYDVVYDDDAVLAVSKPRGLPTMPAGGFLEHTLLTLVRVRYPGAHPMHRLGRHTSGLVLFARTSGDASRIGRAWRAHAVTKDYRALACGIVEADRFEVDTRIGPMPHPRLGHVHAASRSGRAAHSTVTVIERRRSTTLVGVRITTGRPHQIRIHLASAGHPLAGDPLYIDGGAPSPLEPALPGDGGYLLHAEHLVLTHPRSGAPLALYAVPPAELLTGWEPA